MQRGLVFNIQKYSVQDGPGIRTTVFLKGCPLSCSWCHNPEGIAHQREILVVENRCLACGRCREACPYGVTIAGQGMLPVNNHPCDLCGACVAACPTEARQMIGREMTVPEVMTEVLQDRLFYDDSGGGITVSGGEPLLQPAFLRELLENCRRHGIHTVVDTCGLAGTEDLLASAPLTDLFLYDLKLMDDTQHRQHTGLSNVPVLENLKALSRIHNHIWVRVPLIPGVNDTEQNLEAVARFTASLPGVEQVNLLPYHRSGLQKLRRLGLPCPDEPAARPSEEGMERALAQFRAFGLETLAGG